MARRKYAWQTAIDERVAAGGKLGAKFLSNLSAQYGVDQARFAKFSNKNNYQLGPKVLGQSPTNEPFNAGNYDKFKLSDVAGLTSYLESQINPGKGVSNPMAIMTGSRGGYDGAMKMLASYMGVNKINSKKEINKALSILGGASSPVAQALSTQQGINKYDSVNDYLKVLGGGIGSPKASSSAQTGAGSGAGAGSGSGMMDDSYSFTPEEIEDPAPPQYSPGGAGSALDGGATGMRTRRSKWRMLGKTKKGTANLKITGQTGASSGLNLGI